jgi:hypothetical protein
LIDRNSRQMDTDCRIHVLDQAAASQRRWASNHRTDRAPPTSRAHVTS